MLTVGIKVKRNQENQKINLLEKLKKINNLMVKHVGRKRRGEAERMHRPY